MRLILISFLAILLSTSSCRNRTEQATVKEKVAIDNEMLIRINKELVSSDISQNESYAKEHEWNYIKTDNGIIYEILSHIEGPSGKSGDQVEFSYLTQLLNGTVCYSSELNGLKKFVVDYQDVESGLNAMAKLLSIGDSVRLILPPYLAFGLAGDGDRVPARSSLLYHLRLLEIHTQD